jgi:hypothetical protein
MFAGFLTLGFSVQLETQSAPADVNLLKIDKFAGKQ